MMSFEFTKYQALGNDYLVIDPNKTKINITVEQIKLICDRHFGIGSDGILYGPIMENGKIAVKIFNPDGSEAEKSGNGLRIFARYLRDERYINDKIVKVHTMGGEIMAEFLDDIGEFIKIDMGSVSFNSNDIPVEGAVREIINEDLLIDDKNFKISCVSIGNPHCVVLCDEVSRQIAIEYGEKFEKHKMFPGKVNVQFLKIVDKNNIQIEIWERGAGYTLSSGSSSCAAASVAHRLEFVEDTINVHMPGGIIKIEVKEKNRIIMTGAVAKVCYGTGFCVLKKDDV